MTNDLIILLSNEGDDQIAVRAQIVDELADRFTGKYLIEQDADSVDVSR